MHDEIIAEAKAEIAKPVALTPEGNDEESRKGFAEDCPG
jgi:hypothetical protein